MVVRSGGASRSSLSGSVNHDSEKCSKSAAIFTFPKEKLPPILDYNRACADLIAATFPASSRRGVCQRAATETRLASADTFNRILSGDTGRVDAYLMRAVMHFAADRKIAIPPALAVRQ